MTLLTIDFETYFDNECTLKKLNYLQYLNHPHFEVLGAAILTDKIHTFLPHDDLQDFLSTLDPETTSVLAHNTLFDGMILSWIYHFNPAHWLDILSMSKGLLALDSYSLESVGQHFGLPHKKLATFKGKTWAQLTPIERSELIEYAKHDAWLCHEIYNHLLPYPKNELDLIDLTIRMFTEPKLQLDIPLAERLLKEQQDHKTKLLKETQLTKTQLASNQQFAKLLEEKYNIEIPKKISLTTNEETYALAKNDPEFQELQLKAPDEVKKLIEARLATKSTIEETRINTLIETQNLVGAIPVPLIYYGGHTGRWSGCLVASTRILTYNTSDGLIEKCIDKVTLDDLIWDGETFVEHDGLQFSGFKEVIEHDGLTGTPDHLVFVDGYSEAISLQTALQTNYNLQTAKSPNQNALDMARTTLTNRNQKQN